MRPDETIKNSRELEFAVLQQSWAWMQSVSIGHLRKRAIF